MKFAPLAINIYKYSIFYGSKEGKKLTKCNGNLFRVYQLKLMNVTSGRRLNCRHLDPDFLI